MNQSERLRRAVNKVDLPDAERPELLCLICWALTPHTVLLDPSGYFLVCRNCRVVRFCSAEEFGRLCYAAGGVDSYIGGERSEENRLVFPGWSRGAVHFTDVVFVWTRWGRFVRGALRALRLTR